MGYRSDVRISTSKKGWENIKNKLPMYPDDYNEYVNGFVFGWDYIKWYEGDYEDVDKTIELLKTELVDKGEPYEFLRIGEDLDDVEESQSYKATDPKPDIPHLYVIMRPEIGID